MSTPGSLFLHTTLVLLVGALGCRPRALVEYRVAAKAQGVAIDVVVDGHRPDHLRLRGYAAKEVLRIVDATAKDDQGKPLPLRSGLDTVVVDSRQVEVPYLEVLGPLPPRVVVSYIAQIGSAEGDSHRGLSRRQFGYADSELTFFTGRQVLLVPQPADGIQGITVRFDVPTEQDVSTPWRLQEGAFHPGVERGYALDDLIAGAAAIGRFRSDSVRFGRTRMDFVFPASMDSALRKRTLDRLVLASRYVRDLFGRDLGPTYRTLVLPKSPDGRELVGESWATGQARTLLPLTPSRLSAFAQDLIDAYLRHEPYRLTFRDPREYWLVDGLRNLYGWRAAAAAGMVPEADTERALALAYGGTIGVGGIERNLERLYHSEGRQRSARNTLAPFALLSLDYAIRDATAGRENLATAVRAAAASRNPSLYEYFKTSRGLNWNAFRRRFIQGQQLMETTRWLAIEATRSPAPARASSNKSVTIVYTGRTEGYLENCGCKTNEAGGVARRVTLMRQLRQAHPDLVLLDAGDLFPNPAKSFHRDVFSAAETRFTLSTVARMGYDAVAVAPNELGLGLGEFRKSSTGLPLPFVAASVESAGHSLVTRVRHLRRDDLRVAVVGLLDPPPASGNGSSFEDATAGLSLIDPILAAQGIVPPLKRAGALVVVLGRLSPVTIRRLVTACPEVDVVVSSEDDAPVASSDGTLVGLKDRPGFLGHTLVLYTSEGRYGVNVARVDLGPLARPVGASLERVRLDDRIGDDPHTRSALTDLYRGMWEREIATNAIEPPFAGDSLRQNAEYAGAKACASCHRSEYAQWRETPHASAYKTLLNVHRHYQPQCVSCHVVGFQSPTGFRFGSSDETFANVQCEVCHGPGAEHARLPRRTNIIRQVPAEVCLECHTPEHSDRFVYSERVPKVMHSRLLGSR